MCIDSNANMKRRFSFLIFLALINEASAQIPTFQWAKNFVARNGNNPSVNSNGRSIAVDHQGNVYSAGLFNYTADFDPGPALFMLSAANWDNTAIYVSKLSPTGDFLWAIQIPTYIEFGNIEIKVDNSNNVYIASQLRLPTDFDPGPGEYTLSPAGACDAFVAKYDPSGNLIWAKQLGGAGDVVAQSEALDIDKDNNVVVCGTFNSTVDFDPGTAVYNITSSANRQSFIVKLNSAGNFIWAEQFGNSSIETFASNIGDVKCDLRDDIYVAGDFSGTCDFDPGPGVYLLKGVGMENGYILKLSPDGAFIWAKSIVSTADDYYQYTITRAIDVDASHNVYVAGDFYGTFDFDPGPNTHIVSSSNSDWYILKLNEEGEFAWSDAFGGSSDDEGADVAIDNDGSVYACGTVGPTADMDPGTAVYTLASENPYGSSALVKVGLNGTFISAVSFDQIGSDYGDCLTRRMVADNQGYLYVTGYEAGTIDFDPGPNRYPLGSGEGEAPFVLKLAKCKNITTSTLNVSTCKSYTLNNETFDSTGTYIQVIPNSTGCDSVIKLNLKIDRTYTEQTKTICEGESYFAGRANRNVSGIYNDTLTTSLNCDSIVITHLIVNPKPLPALGPDRDLCSGTEYVINPGIFSHYLWQDMTISNTFTVNTSGLYWVKVTNEFNCTAADSITIKSIMPPDHFLKATDSLCNYQQLTISANGIFDQYLWSTGAVEKQIIVNEPGTYWLNVTDADGCVGVDSISVYRKDCGKGVFLPTAFTPNGDGINDVFRANIFGKIVVFRLQIFNREGQLVFQSTDPSAGWNGSYRGKSYSTTAFVWQCFYQLEGRQPEYQKGTVTLIR